MKYRVLFGIRATAYERLNREWDCDASSPEDARAQAISALRAGEVWFGDDERSKHFEEVSDDSSAGPWTENPRFSVHSIERIGLVKI